MPGHTLQRGTISIHTYPTRIQGDAFRTCSEDFELYVFMRPSEQLHRYFLRAAECCRSGADVYTPCIVEQRVHRDLPHHRGWVLTPNARNQLFLKTVVPDLKLRNVIHRAGEIKGYVLASEYMGGQEFYAPVKERIQDGPGIVYHGMIEFPAADESKRPVVRITTTLDARNPVLEQNAAALEEFAFLRQGPIRFWWDLI